MGGGILDYILICRGEAFTPYTIDHLRKDFPTVKIILYLWDILRCADIRANIPFVDKAMSFDPEDAANNNGLLFRPTFFVNDYFNVRKISNQAKYDVAFIGTLHSNRHKTIKSLSAQLSKQGLNFYIYLYVPSIIVYIKDLLLKFPYIGITKVHFAPISLHETIDILNETIAVFDINYTGQKSLSTRAFEAMAARRKYITTNPEVKRYDFYNPNNILVVNIDDVVIPRQFLNTPFEPVSEKILYKYSVAGLVDDLFNETSNSKSIFPP